MAVRTEIRASEEPRDPDSTTPSKVLKESSLPANKETDLSPSVVTRDPLVGRVLLHYRLEERLGAGGMGVLYRATDLKLGRAVAIKLLARHLVSDETAKARFIREARRQRPGPPQYCNCPRDWGSAGRALHRDGALRGRDPEATPRQG